MTQRIGYAVAPASRLDSRGGPSYGAFRRPPPRRELFARMLAGNYRIEAPSNGEARGCGFSISAGHHTNPNLHR